MSAQGLVWFITGCSSGFGASLSLLALKAGHKVIATSRRPSKTPELVREVDDMVAFGCKCHECRRSYYGRGKNLWPY
jgi:NAD(P)-dependent dehydrogenase (short-subunit alcohol dehydrogenase family)